MSDTLPDSIPAVLLADRDRIAAVVTSHARLTGHPLLEPHADPVAAVWHAPLVILAHGIQPDPLFFLGNRLALAAFETTLDALRRMPSRLSAEPGLRAERDRLLARVTAQGFIDDYAGIRISALGRRFPIARATVWNVHDTAGNRIGQAAAFAPPSHALAAG
ncbi:MAG: MEKHLA domain-containing protein [Sphingomonadales bacterium]|nr:MEKHLA domain-containing protein [Sphingomonadales bacterium]